jgi:hypothetical protein
LTRLWEAEAAVMMMMMMILMIESLKGEKEQHNDEVVLRCC